MADETLIQKADVINFAVILLIVLIAIHVIVQLYIAINSSDPLEVLTDLRTWMIPFVSSILVAYGMKKQGG